MKANSGDHNQTLHSVTSDLGLHYICNILCPTKRKLSLYGSLSKNGGIQKGKIIKKYCPKFHFFSNIFINTNMEKIYGKYVQFKNMYNVSIVNYMDGTLAKMSVQSQTNFLIKNRQFKEFSKFKGVPLEILLKTLMGMNLGLFGCGTCKRNT